MVVPGPRFFVGPGHWMASLAGNSETDLRAEDPEALRGEILGGVFHSVMGDRVSELKKPFREVVVYDPATRCEQTDREKPDEPLAQNLGR